MELIIIRHGLPLRVEKEDGSAADPKLSKTGLMQANKLANWMRDDQFHIRNTPSSTYRFEAPRRKQRGMFIRHLLGGRSLLQFKGFLIRTGQSTKRTTPVSPSTSTT